jgi:hypothetical protein
MNRLSFWRLLLKNAFSIQGVLLALAAIAVGLFFRPDLSIPANLVFLGGIIAAFLLTLVSSMLFEVWPLLRRSPPKVRSAQQITIQGQQRLLLLLEPSDMFGFDAVVSVYRTNGDFEEMIGIGRVLTIQENGFIQITIEQIDPATDGEFVANLGAGNVNALAETLVKPTVPRSYANI